MASVASAGSTAAKTEPFVSKWSDRYRGVRLPWSVPDLTWRSLMLCLLKSTGN